MGRCLKLTNGWTIFVSLSWKVFMFLCEFCNQNYFLFGIVFLKKLWHKGRGLRFRDYFVWLIYFLKNLILMFFTDLNIFKLFCIFKLTSRTLIKYLASYLIKDYYFFSKIAIFVLYSCSTKLTKQKHGPQIFTSLFSVSFIFRI